MINAKIQKKKKIRSNIIKLLTPKKEETKLNVEVVIKEKEEYEKKTNDIYIDERLHNIKKIRKEVEELEHTRLKNGTYEENKELNSKIKELNKSIIKNRQELRKYKEELRQAELKRNNQISSLKYKQNKLLKMLENRISFSNIVKHSDGIEISEIVDVIEKDATVLERMKKIDKRLPYIWLKWKEKFVKFKE